MQLTLAFRDGTSRTMQAFSVIDHPQRGLGLQVVEYVDEGGSIHLYEPGEVVALSAQQPAAS